MAYPPGQGKSGADLMALWRSYLEGYAEAEPDVEAQVAVAAAHAGEVFGWLTLLLDRERSRRALIDARIGYFRNGIARAATLEERLMVAAYTVYNHLNTLARQFSGTSVEALGLIEEVERAVSARIQGAGDTTRAAAALRAAFPLLGLATLVLDQGGRLTAAIRNVEQRFAGGDARASSDLEHLVNALYRMTEMLQLFATLTDAELAGQVRQIAARFQEEDQVADPRLKLRNGFCRLFELAHLVTAHVDAMLPD